MSPSLREQLHVFARVVPLIVACRYVSSTTR